MTPIGAARRPKLSKPDTESEFADNKFKTEIVLSATDTVAFKDELMRAATKILSNCKSPNMPIKTAKDGTISFIFKSKVRPEVADAYGNPIGPEIEIGDWSTLRLAGRLAAYEKGTLKGITGYLDAVQVIELKRAVTAASVFGVVQGGFDVGGSNNHKGQK
jgi:DNA-directed RNA polymerase